MVICHCLAVNDKAITALATADTTVEDIQSLCGAGGRCGGCVDSIEWVLARTKNADRAVAVSLSN